ncbi:SDR family oxidoreductase [Variovorax sp. PAMC28562]|uniref:SDR family NAD(P)-dependent oxidoreductase n=1 Tax=Variovorax sp. PAMC28562 TaxID=2762323 RepID=UPI00164E8E36|nr:SDR family oxidoreductase [Variovorax sp. PAMC28562]QNK72162.1 SDR family oxidoreductase [Variovorax sp. PAMC28562]
MTEAAAFAVEARPVAVVTGAASGIGAATMALLVSRGWRVAGIDIDGATLKSTVDRVNAETQSDAGPVASAFVADVADEAAIVSAFKEIEAAFGTIHGLVTSAGTADTTPFMDLTVDIFRRAHDVNVIGTWLCMREAALRMKPGGRICTVASVAGIRGGGLSGTAAYAASKGAVLALTKNAARALGERGISVNTVAPGATETPMIAAPLAIPGNRQRLESMSVQQRIASPEQIANAIAFLISPEASIVTGSTLVADGGLLMY